MTTTYYITSGNVRGTCGHIHTTLTGAVRCLKRDALSCRRVGGYSDRAVRAVENGQRRELTDVELDVVLA